MAESKLVSPGYVCKCKFDDEKCKKIWLDHCKEWKVIVFDIVAKTGINSRSGIGRYHAKESNINQNSFFNCAKLCEFI